MADEHNDRLVRVETTVSMIYELIKALPCPKHADQITALKIADEKANTAMVKSTFSVYLSIIALVGTLASVATLFLKLG